MKSLVVLLLLISSISYSQDKVIYTGGIMTTTYSDKSGKIYSQQNTAKNVVLVYDKFFKSYSIDGETEEDNLTFKLIYLNTLENKVNIYDNGNETYYVFDNLSQGGSLIFSLQKNSDPNIIITYSILNLKP